MRFEGDFRPSASARLPRPVDSRVPIENMERQGDNSNSDNSSPAAPVGRLPLPALDRDDPETVVPGEVIPGEVIPGEMILGESIPGDGVLSLQEVIESAELFYPLLQVAMRGRQIAAGEHLSAHGAFDTKLKAASKNGPSGFYETYRQSIGLQQPTYGGGMVFGGYRLGRGSFQPWYLERQTDLGGEFVAGFEIPLARNVGIDQRRAQLWRTNLNRQQVEPEIRLQRLQTVRAATYAYWDWVAAGRRFEIDSGLLRIARDRHAAIKRKVEEGDADPPVLDDNQRLIVSREAKQIESRRKLRMAAIKLSLFWRDQAGEPVVATAEQLADFPDPIEPQATSRREDIENALRNRPDFQWLDFERRKLELQIAEARNDLRPDLRAILSASQDVGDAATSKNDKSEFELSAGITLDVPIERRKARGKIAAVSAKVQQNQSKMQMVADKIKAEVQAVHADLTAAYQRIERARQSIALANRLADVERRKFDLGESELLAVNLREQQAAESAATLVESFYAYFTARADYTAILAREP